jgi:hypothetical protein
LNVPPESVSYSSGRSTSTTSYPMFASVASIAWRARAAGVVPSAKPAVMPTLRRQRGTTFFQRTTGVAAATRSGTGGSPIVRGSSFAGPASTSVTIAASFASRASGPMWSRVIVSGMTPKTEQRPCVGFSAVSPFAVPGPVIEPPVCVPSVQVASRAPVAHPEPPDEPLGEGPGSLGDHALRVVETPWIGDTIRALSRSFARARDASASTVMYACQ